MRYTSKYPQYKVLMLYVTNISFLNYILFLRLFDYFYILFQIFLPVMKISGLIGIY